MALKQLLLSRKIQEKRSALDALREQKADLETRRAAMKTRETELEEAVKEITDQTEETVKEEVEKAVSEFENDVAALEQDEKDNAEKIADLEKEVDGLQEELEALNEKINNDPPADPVPPEEPADVFARSERSKTPMLTRENLFGSAQERSALFARQDMKDFSARLRDLGRQNRAVSGGELLIPEIILPLIREITAQNSKLLPLVNLQQVGGTSRQTVMGTIPEAVWTEMCAKINEISLTFTAAEVDGFKVAAFVPVCNALLEDNDIALASQVVWTLGCAIALALDKAILYGTGTKMPLGIVTRLAQTAAPADYSAKERAWADLHTSNIIKITVANSTGITLYQKLIEAFGAASVKFGTNGMFWAMNHKTRMKLVSEALNFNAAGAIVTGIDNAMPVIGGQIVELDFIPDDNIIAGYGVDYLLAERAGVAIEQSEHVRFLDDQTVFRGKARYDGKPVIAEGFVVIGVNNITPTTTMTFAQDAANA
jgi:HK97 family phage major capsid protein